MTSIATAAVAALSASGLAAVATWQLAEWLIYTLFHGDKWLVDILSVRGNRSQGLLLCIKQWLRWLGRAPNGKLSRAVPTWRPQFFRHWRVPTLNSYSRVCEEAPHRTALEAVSSDANSSLLFHATNTSGDLLLQNGQGLAHTASNGSAAQQPSLSAQLPRHTSNLRFRRRPVLDLHVPPEHAQPMSSAQIATAQPTPIEALLNERMAIEGIEALRVRDGKMRLSCLSVTEAIGEHEARVDHLQFSPDGTMLATASTDRTTVIHRVNVSVHQFFVMCYRFSRDLVGMEITLSLHAS